MIGTHTQFVVGHILHMSIFFSNPHDWKSINYATRSAFLITPLVSNVSVSFTTYSLSVIGALLAAQNVSEVLGINLTEACILYIVGRNYSTQKTVSALSRSQPRRAYLQSPLNILNVWRNRRHPSFTVKQACSMLSIWCPSYNSYEECCHVIVTPISVAITVEIMLRGHLNHAPCLFYAH